MIVVLDKHTERNILKNIESFIRSSGCELKTTVFNGCTAVSVSEEKASLDKKALRELPGVSSIINVATLFQYVTRAFKQENTVISLGDAVFGGDDPVIIAGPCAVESERQILDTAFFVKEHGAQLLRGGAFKPRTSPYSFQGLEEKGLKLLQKAKEETGLLVVTEVLDTADLPLVAAYADVLQIGSRNMHNSKLLRAVGGQDKPVLLKRGMSAQLEELLMSAEYIVSEGNERVILCERGIRTHVDYTRNTLDLSIIPAVQKISHLPIIVDPSHATGRRDLIEPMSIAALAAGAQGLMIEVHPDPDRSLSDPDQTLSFAQFATLMKRVDLFTSWSRTHKNRLQTE
ncbi:3-deoxy-7-phosphoheptulonate synthase [candidate division KSB1 bacterium]